MADPREIAAGLSDREINLLFLWPKGLFDQGTRRVLSRKGLIDGRRVTPLGEQVRAALKGQGNG